MGAKQIESGMAMSEVADWKTLKKLVSHPLPSLGGVF
jgi:hypothetical protein